MAGAIGSANYNPVDYNDENDDGLWLKDELESDCDEGLQSVTTKSKNKEKPLQLLAVRHNNKSKLVNWPSAVPASPGKALSTRQRCHFNKIMNNFVERLMGSGTFGWQTLIRSGSKQEVDLIWGRHGITRTVPAIVKVDCCSDSQESDATVLQIQKLNFSKITKKRKSLQEVCCSLAACSEETDKASCALTKWRQMLSKQHTRQPVQQNNMQTSR